MNIEFYIQRPQPTVVVQLSEADETDILAALANPNLTNTRHPDGHWTFEAGTGRDHEANDGDWVALNGYFIVAADDLRASSGWQQVPSDTVNYDVT